MSRVGWGSYLFGRTLSIAHSCTYIYIYVHPCAFHLPVSLSSWLCLASQCFGQFTLCMPVSLSPWCSVCAAHGNVYACETSIVSRGHGRRQRQTWRQRCNWQGRRTKVLDGGGRRPPRGSRTSRGWQSQGLHAREAPCVCGSTCSSIRIGGPADGQGAAGTSTKGGRRAWDRCACRPCRFAGGAQGRAGMASDDHRASSIWLRAAAQHLFVCGRPAQVLMRSQNTVWAFNSVLFFAANTP